MNLTDIYIGFCAIVIVLTLGTMTLILHYDHTELPAHATIGGQQVPAIECEEDEVIGFIGIPDTLVCIHYEEVTP